jgi:hypothetical protein
MFSKKLTNIYTKKEMAMIWKLAPERIYIVLLYNVYFYLSIMDTWIATANFVALCATKLALEGKW